MNQTPVSPEDPALIGSVTDEVLRLTSHDPHEARDELLQVAAAAHALRHMGLDTKIDVMDVIFQDSESEGARVFGFYWEMSLVIFRAMWVGRE